MLICTSSLSSGSLPSTLSIIPLTFFLQPKDVSAQPWFCAAGDHHGWAWLQACSVKGWKPEVVGPSPRAAWPQAMDSPTCVHEDLQNRWGVDLLVLLSWLVADCSKDSAKPQQLVHMSSREGLKSSMKRCYFIAPATFRLALVPVWFSSFKTLIESQSFPQHSNGETLWVPCFSSFWK